MLLSDIFLKNSILKLFKIWLAGYTVGVLLAVSLFKLQQARFFRQETKQRFLPQELFKHYSRNVEDLSEDSQLYWKLDHWIPLPYQNGEDESYEDNWPQSLPIFAHRHEDEDRRVAKAIAGKVRVFCIVMITTDNYRYKRRVQLIKETWGKRCDKLIFMRTEAAIKENDLWNRDIEAFQDIYKKHSEEADWFVRADDVTYLIIENLKYMLKDYSSSEAVYFSCMPDDNPEKLPYFRAGYIFSRETMKTFVNKAHICNVPKSENILIERCLRTLNIKMLDSRDFKGRGRIFPYSPPYLVIRSRRLRNIIPQRNEHLFILDGVPRVPLETFWHCPQL
ncbi:glycoprotein-N-acetylgalactosamine 3-beta-galactosyltransferase 1-like isoform X2 [Plodia interpunctella]|uniref:glycoprotein-N-acetylgalactosamine 3-beta-galactosyltransferase 1-like isoform X2 n=1 Tax=Plodia interpunctella TaxID=58824 RepID=UPI0023682AB4|nr:glycoprotein-N-acetylgalactosamine 3-beta-galactosyltransferase 1-like isoform X2 [Plodia interpunctella]